MSKTLSVSRTIRRKLPNGWFVYIGRNGLGFRQRRKKEAYLLLWEEAIARAMFLRIPSESVSPAEPVNVPEAEQMPMFPYVPVPFSITPEAIADAHMESMKGFGDPIGTASRSIADTYVDAYADTLGPSGTFNEDPLLDEPEALRIAERVNKVLDEEVDREG